MHHDPDSGEQVNPLMCIGDSRFGVGSVCLVLIMFVAYTERVFG